MILIHKGSELLTLVIIIVQIVYKMLTFQFKMHVDQIKVKIVLVNQSKVEIMNVNHSEVEIIHVNQSKVEFIYTRLMWR